ncbi:hypothetical protein [Novosphingobium sp. ST904]|uniref:hypothetical protein n=1 Tax=Novosphingobium sp. ST904 TaxID=1684385 RepID=UPI000AE43BDB|nr:hypothetical protein [Novosphingobium sp. ST904]
MKPGLRRALARGLAAAAVLAAMLASVSVAHADAAGEAKASALFDELSGNAAMLRLFLQAMPKGGDLHNHLGGTPSAEDWLDWAGKAGFCAGSDLKLLPPPCADADRITRIAAERPFDYARLVDHLGTRGWQKGIGRDEVSGHTQFFISFERFGPVAPGHTVPAMEVALRTSAGDSATYLELMHNPDAMMAYILAALMCRWTRRGLRRAMRRNWPVLPRRSPRPAPNWTGTRSRYGPTWAAARPRPRQPAALRSTILPAPSARCRPRRCSAR